MIVIDTFLALTHDELLTMIRHGAKEIMRGNKKGEQGDQLEQIEDLIKRGEERTVQLQEKYKNAGMDDLQRFSTTIKSYEWEGEDYSKRKLDSDDFYLQPAKRERKATYADDPYFTATKTVKAPVAKPPKPPKQVKMQVSFPLHSLYRQD